jgi:hypothetical protein
MDHERKPRQAGKCCRPGKIIFRSFIKGCKLFLCCLPDGLQEMLPGDLTAAARMPGGSRARPAEKLFFVHS